MKASIAVTVAVALLGSCDPHYLDEKPRSSLVVPKSLKDFEQLLNHQRMFETSELAEVSSDDYYLERPFWQGINDPAVRNAHIWASDIYGPADNNAAWSMPYQHVFYANVVLEGLQALPVLATEGARRDRVKGTALFIRAYAFYQLAQVFAKAYVASTAQNDTGIPLPLVPDVSVPVSRSSVAETYGRILSDLEESTGLLTDEVKPGSPSRAAAYAMLARVCLSMGDYTGADGYAERSLELFDTLLDFNAITPSSYDVRTGVLYGTGMSAAVLLTVNGREVLTTPELYALYGDSDLRKTIYFRVNAAGKPYKAQGYSYYYHFTGLSTDEMYLVRAECLARSGHAAAALAMLNHLLRHRFLNGAFSPLEAPSAAVALEMVMRERRKELVFRGIRWTDLRRLNAAGAAIGLRREMDGSRYSLPPLSPLWVLPIPQAEISLGGVQQNPRPEDNPLTD